MTDHRASPLVDPLPRSSPAAAGAHAAHSAAPGLVVAGAAAAFWVTFGVAVGPQTLNDSLGYLRLADALARLRVPTGGDAFLGIYRGSAIVRTPGYPLLLLACRGLATLLRSDALVTTIVVQVLLLAGLGTWLVYDLGLRLSGRRTSGVVAAGLFALDVDVQNLAVTILSEPLAIVCVIAAFALRVRDGGWRRAGVALAVLVLTRPNFLPVPLGLAAADVVWRRRPLAAAAAVAPSVAVMLVWWGIVWGAGGAPFAPQRALTALHAFGKVYEGELWQALPPGPARTLLAAERAKGHGMYDAALAVREARGEPALMAIAGEAARADPCGFARLCLGLVPQAFRGDSFYMPYWNKTRAAWIAPVNSWRQRFDAVAHRSFALFALLIVAVSATGFGAAAAAESFRWVLAPFLVVLFGTIALFSWNYEIGRLAVSFHVVEVIVWGLFVAALADDVCALAAAGGRRVAGGTGHVT